MERVRFQPQNYIQIKFFQREEIAFLSLRANLHCNMKTHICKIRFCYIITSNRISPLTYDLNKVMITSLEV